MLSYTDAELEHLLADTESDAAERKESWKGDAPEKGRQAVCAFANDLAGRKKPGVLFVGIKDDGTPSGLAIDDRLLQTLGSIKDDGKVLPPPTLIVEKRVLRGAEVAVVTVLPADAPPVRYDGRIWIRLGPRRGIATAQDERVLNERRKYRDRPFDVQPVHSAILSNRSRLNFEFFYLPAAFAPDVLAANERTLDERLAACRLAVSPDDPTPTVLGVLVLSESPKSYLPGAYLQFLRIAGKEFSDPIIDALEIDRPLDELIRRLDEKMAAHNTVAIDITTAHTEIRTHAYPAAALQQLTRNAVLHRTYEASNAPTRVYWFDDRIEIISPGGPYGAVTVENFGRPGVTDYRNPHVAEAMKVLGLIQRFGIGIDTARKALEANGSPPLEFRVEQSSVTAIVRKRV